MPGLVSHFIKIANRMIGARVQGRTKLSRQERRSDLPQGNRRDHQRACRAEEGLFCDTQTKSRTEGHYATSLG